MRPRDDSRGADIAITLLWRELERTCGIRSNEMRGRALRGPFPKIRMVAEKGSVKMPLASRIRYCTAAPAEIGIEPIAACAALVILRGLEVQEGAALLRRSTTDHTCICWRHRCRRASNRSCWCTSRLREVPLVSAPSAHICCRARTLIRFLIDLERVSAAV